MSMYVVIDARGSGANFCNLMTDGFKVRDGYFPATSTEGDQLTETIDVLVQGESREDLLAKITKVKNALHYCEANADDPDNYGRFGFLIDDSTGALPYFAKVFKGRVILNERADHDYRQSKMAIQIEITRTPYFEVQSLPIPEEYWTNNNTKYGLTGNYCQVFNCCDAQIIGGLRHVHGAALLAPGIPGDLPAKAQLVFSTANQNNGGFRKVWLFQQVWEYGNGDDPYMNWDLDMVKQFWQEGEENNNLEPIGYADATCSDGGYARTADGAQWTFYNGWGRPRKFMARIRFSHSEKLKITARVYHGTTVYPNAQYDEVITYHTVTATKWYIVDLGTFIAGTSVVTSTLELIQGNGAGRTLDIDWIFMAPLDGWRYIELPDDASDGVVDDGYKDECYINNIIVCPSVGPGFMIEPGRLNIFFALWENNCSGGTTDPFTKGVIGISCMSRSTVL